MLNVVEIFFGGVKFYYCHHDRPKLTFPYIFWRYILWNNTIIKRVNIHFEKAQKRSNNKICFLDIALDSNFFFLWKTLLNEDYFLSQIDQMLVTV